MKGARWSKELSRGKWPWLPTYAQQDITKIAHISFGTHPVQAPADKPPHRCGDRGIDGCSFIGTSRHGSSASAGRHPPRSHNNCLSNEVHAEESTQHAVLLGARPQVLRDYRAAPAAQVPRRLQNDG